jgi:hypothetical protein
MATRRLQCGGEELDVGRFPERGGRCDTERGHKHRDVRRNLPTPRRPGRAVHGWLQEILHDWPDDKAVEIVAAIRRACRPGAVLLVIENVILDGAPDPRVHNLDVLMLIITGGRERTAAQLRTLLSSAGFQVTSITQTHGPMRIVESVAV